MPRKTVRQEKADTIIKELEMSVLEFIDTGEEDFTEILTDKQIFNWHNFHIIPSSYISDMSFVLFNPTLGSVLAFFKMELAVCQ